MTFQERIKLAFAEAAARRADAGLPRLTKTDLWKAADASSGAASHWFNGSNGMDLATCVKVAPILGVRAQWLYDGSGSKLADGADEGYAAAARPSDWPFPSISEADVRALSPAQLGKLEGALALAISQLRLGVDVAPNAPASLPRRGELFAADPADDAFPMRIPGLPAGPLELEQPRSNYRLAARLSTDQAVVANVAPGEPVAANDKFEKVPELADVRLAAGEGIENHTEEQTGVVQFRRSFLRSVGADNGRARVVYARGDSMEPVIRDGAALLVVPDENLTLQDLAAGGVYAINYDGKMIVKTVAKDRLTGRWMARSFNPQHPDVPLEGESPVRVLGRVVWTGFRLTGQSAIQWVRR